MLDIGECCGPLPWTSLTWEVHTCYWWVLWASPMNQPDLGGTYMLYYILGSAVGLSCYWGVLWASPMNQPDLGGTYMLYYILGSAVGLSCYWGVLWASPMNQPDLGGTYMLYYILGSAVGLSHEPAWPGRYIHAKLYIGECCGPLPWTSLTWAVHTCYARYWWVLWASPMNQPDLGSTYMLYYILGSAVGLSHEPAWPGRYIHVMLDIGECCGPLPWTSLTWEVHTCYTIYWGVLWASHAIGECCGPLPWTSLTWAVHTCYTIYWGVLWASHAIGECCGPLPWTSLTWAVHTCYTIYWGVLWASPMNQPDLGGTYILYYILGSAVGLSCYWAVLWASPMNQPDLGGTYILYYILVSAVGLSHEPAWPGQYIHAILYIGECCGPLPWTSLTWVLHTCYTIYWGVLWASHAIGECCGPLPWTSLTWEVHTCYARYWGVRVLVSPLFYNDGAVKSHCGSFLVS